MYQIKYLYHCLAGLMVAILLTTCTAKAPVYPDLEGYWKLERVEHHSSGEIVEPHRLYWSLQLGIIKLNDRGNGVNPQIIGAYIYDDVSHTLKFPEMYIGKVDARPEQLQPNGVPEIGVTFDVLLCDGERMILRCDEFTVYLGAF